MSEVFVNPGDPIDHHSLTGSKPSGNPNPLAPKPSGGVLGRGSEFTPDQKRQRQANQDQVLKYGAEHAGFETGHGLSPDEAANQKYKQTSYMNQVISQQANPGDPTGASRQYNSMTYDDARAGNSVAAGQVRDTDAVIAGSMGDNSANPDYRLVGDHADETRNLVNASGETQKPRR
jgi:hypothetical protein